MLPMIVKYTALEGTWTDSTFSPSGTPATSGIKRYSSADTSNFKKAFEAQIKYDLERRENLKLTSYEIVYG